MDYGQRPDEQSGEPGNYAPSSGQDSPGGYQPGSGQPAPSGGYQPAGGSYGQTPGPESHPEGQGGYQYQAAAKKGGFNWLACCGIGCGVVLVISLLVGMLLWKSCAPLFEMGKQMESVGKEVAAASPETVRAEASYIDATELRSQLSSLQGQWVAVEGKVTGIDAMAGSSFSSGGFNSQDSTSYLLEGGVLVLDTSKAPNAASVGEYITAYGKAVEFDLGKIPFLKGVLDEAAKEDPELAAMGGGRMIFVITQDVEKTGEADPPSAAEDSEASPAEAGSDAAAAPGGK